MFGEQIQNLQILTFIEYDQKPYHSHLSHTQNWNWCFFRLWSKPIPPDYSQLNFLRHDLIRLSRRFDAQENQIAKSIVFDLRKWQMMFSSFAGSDKSRRNIMWIWSYKKSKNKHRQCAEPMRQCNGASNEVCVCVRILKSIPGDVWIEWQMNKLRTKRVLPYSIPSKCNDKKALNLLVQYYGTSWFVDYFWSKKNIN